MQPAVACQKRTLVHSKKDLWSSKSRKSMHRSDWSTCFLLTQPKHNRLLLHILAVSDQFMRVVGGCRFMQQLSMNGIMIRHVGGKVTRALHKKHKCTRYMLWETHSILMHLLQHWHCYISPPINLVNLWLTPGWKAPNLWLTPGLKASQLQWQG